MTESSTDSMNSPLTSAIESAAKTAGLVVLSTRAGSDFNGAPTTCFVFGLNADTASDRTLQLELSNTFDPTQSALLPELTSYLRESALRLRNPRPDCYVTLAGLPIRFADFRWPFHRSTSGSDTYVVHGVAHLEDGTASPLHAKIAASMTVTFAEIVAAPEQPYAESFIYNAVRKTLDRGQMEMIKSGNRQPVPVTTRYYSRWQKKFVFSDTDDEARTDFLALKLYWLSGVLGDSQPVVDCRSQGRAVSEHHPRSTATRGNFIGWRGVHQAGGGPAVRCRHAVTVAARRALPHGSGGCAGDHQARLQ